MSFNYNLARQIVKELEQRSDDVNQIGYGEITLTIQDNHLVRWDIRKQFKVADPKNGRPERRV